MHEAKRLHFRAAEKADGDALATFSRETFAATFAHLYPPHDLAQYFAQTRTTTRQEEEIEDPSTEIRLALDGQTIVGFCHIGAFHLPFDKGDRRALELHRLYISDALKGSGLADALMVWAIERANARGAQDFYLGVYAENARAQAFYRRHGFEIVGAYQFPVGGTLDDERIMRLSLTVSQGRAQPAGAVRAE